MIDLKVALVPLARVNFDMELAASITKAFRTQLIFKGFRVEGSAQLITDLASAQAVAQELAQKDFDLLLIFQATFADSSMVTTLVEVTDKPVLLWGVPEEITGGRLRLNSFCGLNLAAHALTLRKKKYSYIYATPQDPAALERLRSITMAASVLRKLHKTRLGLIGERPSGMDTCDLDASSLEDTFGLQIAQVELERVFERVGQVPPARTAEIRSGLEKQVSGLAQLDQEPLNRSLNAYSALKEIAQEEKLVGMAIRCWPEFFTELKCAACGPISMLTNDDLPCSCEADINGTVTQLILQYFSGQPAFNTDLVMVDPEKDMAVLWHCGSAPLSMADPGFQPRATIHSNRRLPLLMEFPLRPGPLTLARLSKATGDWRLVVGRCEVLSAPPSFSGTSGVVRFDKPVSQVIDTLLKEGLEHHLSIAYGNHVPALEALADMLAIPILHL